MGFFRKHGFIVEKIHVSNLEEALIVLSEKQGRVVEATMPKSVYYTLEVFLRNDNYIYFVEETDNKFVTVSFAKPESLFTFPPDFTSRSHLLTDPRIVDKLISNSELVGFGNARSVSDIVEKILEQREGVFLTMLINEREAGSGYVVSSGSKIYASLYTDTLIFLGLDALKTIFAKLPLLYVSHRVLFKKPVFFSDKLLT